MAIFTLLYGCGLRISEAISINLEDIQSNELIKIRGKGGKEGPEGCGKQTKEGTFIVVNSAQQFIFKKIKEDAEELKKKYREEVKGEKKKLIFAGKGWGHGVGISQYGTLNLANAGVSAEMILSTYFPGTQILPYSEIK